MATDSKKLPPGAARLIWEEPQDVAQFAHAFNVQAQQDGIVLTIGQAMYPLLSGSPDEVQSQGLKIREVPARILGRYILTFQRAQELQQLLTQILTNLPPELAKKKTAGA